jgi:hypothetical protein
MRAFRRFHDVLVVPNGGIAELRLDAGRVRLLAGTTAHLPDSLLTGH